jgi:hypothetical protein
MSVVESSVVVIETLTDDSECKSYEYYKRVQYGTDELLVFWQ